MLGKTLFIYFAKQLLRGLIIVGGSIAMLLFLLEFVNLRTRIDTGIFELLEMTFYKAPELLFNSIPLITLLSFMFVFYQSNEKKEMVIARASGLSTTQIFIPSVVISFVLGLFYIAVLQPISISAKEKYTVLYDSYDTETTTTIKTSDTGLWLREKLDGGNTRIINAKNIEEENYTLKDIEIININKLNQIKFLEIDKISLKNNKWVIGEITKGTYNQEYINTTITWDMIEKVFTKSKDISFWDLYVYIKYLQDSDFNSRPMVFNFNYLLSMPFMFIALVFIAGYFTAQPTSRINTKKTVRNGVLSGFVLYFYMNSMKSVIFIIPLSPYILGWIPTLSVLFISIVLLLSSDKLSK
ncbi:MAG: LptF/LptG family permease [Alphaproteobacteria bacterium]